MGEMFQQRIPVRFSHVDWARIIYFPRLFDLLHGVMEDFFAEAAGRSYAEMLETERIGFPTVHLESVFQRPMPFGRTLVVDMGVIELGTSRVIFEYRVKVENDSDWAAVVHQTVVAVNMDSWTSVPIPDDYRSTFEAFAIEALRQSS